MAKDQAERDRLWAGRRGAFGAMTKLRRTTSSMTGRCRAPSCPRCFARWREVGKKYNVEIGNVFHAGDGNLHPLVLFHQLDKDETKRASDSAMDILEACAGSGERSVGSTASGWRRGMP